MTLYPYTLPLPVSSSIYPLFVFPLCLPAGKSDLYQHVKTRPTWWFTSSLIVLLFHIRLPVYSTCTWCGHTSKFILHDPIQACKHRLTLWPLCDFVFHTCLSVTRSSSRKASASAFLSLHFSANDLQPLDTTEGRSFSPSLHAGGLPAALHNWSVADSNQNLDADKSGFYVFSISVDVKG